MSSRPAIAGVAYFALVFMAGAGFGTVRTLLLEPRLGPLPATLAELPLMLGVSWLGCGWVLRRLDVSADLRNRLLMGGIAFTLLMAAELSLTVLAVGGSVADHFQAYRDPARLVGLVGQLLFAAFPLVRARG